MKRNTLKIISNPYTKQLSYYFKNEIGEWDVLSSNSPLSRKYYTNTSIKERGHEILNIINDVYNRKNKGVDIIFEGTSKEYSCLDEEVRNNYIECNINCRTGTTRIAILGKRDVGKTYLIEGMEELEGCGFTREEKEEYIQYTDNINNVQWFEIRGIDLGTEHVEKAMKTMQKLAAEGLSTVIYCISAVAGKCEDIESNMISQLVDEYVDLKVMVALTLCYKDDIISSMDEIEKLTSHIKIVPTLAKNYKTAMKDKHGIPIEVESFGLKEISEYVFEGR